MNNHRVCVCRDNTTDVHTKPNDGNRGRNVKLAGCRARLTAERTRRPAVAEVVAAAAASSGIPESPPPPPPPSRVDALRRRRMLPVAVVTSWPPDATAAATDGLCRHRCSPPHCRRPRKVSGLTVVVVTALKSKQVGRWVEEQNRLWKRRS